MAEQNTETENNLTGRLRTASSVMGLLAFLTGCLVLVGWALDVPALKSVLPQFVTMKTNTAVGFVCAGLSLLLLGETAWPVPMLWLSRTSAGVVALLGLLTSIQYLSGVDFCIDQLIFHEPAGTVGTLSPNRMAPATAVNFLLLGGALLLAGFRRAIPASQRLALATGLMGLLPLLGYLYHAPSLYGIGIYTKMAVHTSTLFIVLGTGLLLAHPARGFMGAIISGGMDGWLLRRFLPFVVGLPILLGWLRLLGEDVRYFESEFGVALMMVTVMVLFGSLTWWIAKALGRLEAERKHAAAELAGMTAEWQDTFDAVNDYVFILDAERRIVRANLAMRKAFAGKNLIGRRCFEVVHGAAQYPASCIACNTYLTGEIVHAEMQEPHLGNRWFSIGTFPLKDNAGAVKRVVHVMKDITERKENEARLLRQNAELQHAKSVLMISERRYRGLFTSAQDGILIVNADTGDILAVNPCLLQMLGYTQLEYTGRKLWETASLEHVSACKEIFQELQTNPSANRVDVQLQTSTGEYKTVDIFGHVFRDKDNSNNVIQYCIRDVSERMRAINRLRNVNELQAQFVAEASHELRTPLTIIKESVSQVVDGICGELKAEQKSMLGMCMDGIVRLQNLINDLLDMSKLEAGKVVLQRKSIDMTQLLNDIRAMFLTQVQAKGLTLTVTSPTPTVPVYADWGRMMQVLTNLVGNAVKFTDQGSIELSIRDLDRVIEVSVGDTGSGLSAADLPKVFGRFQQFGASSRGPSGGTGLGLSIAKSLIELHGGTISVASIENQGATFTFTLPKMDAHAILLDCVAKAIASAQSDNNDMALFIFDVKTGLHSGTTGTLPVHDASYARIRKLLLNAETVIQGMKFTTSLSENRLAVFSTLEARHVPGVGLKLKEVFKKCFFTTREKGGLTLLCGQAVFPADARDAAGLVARATQSMNDASAARLAKTILIVDDEPAVRSVLRMMLEMLGYRAIAEADSGNAALTKIDAAIPDLILLDIRMTDSSGYDVIGKLKTQADTAAIPIVIVTGATTELHRFETDEQSVIPVIHKPVDIEELKRWLDYLL